MAEKLLVPGQGYASYIQLAHTNVQYELIGPVSSAAFLLELEVVFQTSAGGTFEFSASVGRTPQASLSGLESGSPLIQRSDFTVGQVNVMRMTPGASTFGRFRLPIGVWAGDAVRYVVFVGAWTGSGQTVDCLVGLRTLRPVLQGRDAVPT